MKRSYRLFLSFAVCCAVLASSVPAVTRGEDKVPAARRLPSRVVGYISIRDTNDLKEKFNASLMGQLCNHPDLEPIRESINDLIQERSGMLEEKAGISADELLSIPQGEIAIAVVQLPGKAYPAPVALIDFGDKGEIVKTLLGRISEDMQDRGVERSVEMVGDDEVTLHQEPADEGARPAGGVDLAHCVKGNTLVIGKGLNVVKTVLDRWDGEHDNTLMSNDVFSYVSKKCHGKAADDPLVTWYLDPISLLQTALAGNPQAAMVVGFMPVLGLNNLKAIGGTVTMGEEEFDTVSRTMFYIEQPAAGVLNVFNFPTASQGPPAWVSKNAASYTEINWGVEKAYHSIEALVDTFQGPGTTELFLEQISDRAFNGDLQLKDDVIDVLTGKIRIVGDMPDKNQPEATRSLVALEVKNGDDAKAALATIAQMDGFSGEEREFRGVTIYEFPLPNQLAQQLNAGGGVEDAEQAEKMIGIAVSKNHLMIGIDVTILEQVLRYDESGGSLADSPIYKKIAANFPAETSTISFAKSDAEIRAAYEFMKSGNAGFVLGDALEGIDFESLPDFETIRKFLAPKGSYTVPDERGYFSESFSLKKAE